MIHPPVQIEFSELLEELWAAGGIPAAAPRQPARKPRQPQTDGSAAHVALNRVLYRQNLAFPTYVLMRAVGDPGGPTTLAGLAAHVGASYHAVRHQVRRTPWFIVTAPSHDNVGANQSTGPLVAIRLTDAARAKLSQISNLLTHELRSL